MEGSRGQAAGAHLHGLDEDAAELRGTGHPPVASRRRGDDGGHDGRGLRGGQVGRGHGLLEPVEAGVGVGCAARRGGRILQPRGQHGVGVRVGGGGPVALEASEGGPAAPPALPLPLLDARLMVLGMVLGMGMLGMVLDMLLGWCWGWACWG